MTLFFSCERWILAVVSMVMLAIGTYESTSFRQILPPCYESEGIDGYVTSMHVTGSTIVMAYAGNGQACYDGRISWHAVDDGRLLDAIHLGESSEPAKERALFSASPRVIAAIDENRVLINLICGPRFPDSGEGGITGNVVLFDRETEQLQNLTMLSRDDKYIQGLAWFADREIVLCEESALGGSDMASPDSRTGAPVIIRLSDGERISFEEHRDILDWYSRYRQTEAARMHREPVEAPRSFPLMNGFQLSWQDGAILLRDDAGGIEIALARGSIVSVDLGGGYFTYQTTENQNDPRGFHKFDFAAYLAHLRGAFSLPSDGLP
jgi:hypothetical protein